MTGALNNTDNTINFVCIWDATTSQLGRAAFVHHLVFPGSTLVIAPSVLDMFSFDEELGLYLPLFSTTEATVAHYAQVFYEMTVELLALSNPPKVIFTDLVGVDCLSWTAVSGDATVQFWADSTMGADICPPIKTISVGELTFLLFCGFFYAR